MFVLRNGLFAKTTDEGLYAREKLLAGRPKELAACATTALKTLEDGVRARSEDWSDVAPVSLGVFPRSAASETTTPLEPGDAAPSARARRADEAGATHWPVATSEMFVIATLLTPSSEAKELVIVVMSARWPKMSEGLSGLFASDSEKAKVHRTFGTEVGLGDCEGVAVSDGVVVAEKDGDPERLAVLVVERVGVTLVVAVNEGVLEEVADGDDEGAK